MNTKITTDSRQNPAPVSRPCGREDGLFSNPDLFGNKNLHPSKMAFLTDENLYALCKQYGERARIWRQRFAGLLPEVFKRKLYEKKGFHSIFEFAKKLAGMSEEQVRLVLNLEKRFETMPALRSLLTTGKVSVNKLSRIVSIAKPENAIFLATQVQILSKSAVETLVRDEKFATQSDKKNDKEFISDHTNFSIANGLQESFFDPKVVPGQMCFDTKNTKSNNGENISVEAYNGRAGKSNPLNLSAEVQEKLLELQQKGLDINAIILESLQKREQEIAQKKEEISKKSAPPSPSRHIPISIKRILYAEHGTKCSVKTCKKLSEQIHHVRRFSAVPSHDPHYLAPLCKAHHELAHCRDIDYLEIRKKAC